MVMDVGTLIPVSAVALDLDGTLLDTADDLALAVNAMLAEAGERPLAPELVRTFVGKGMGNLVRRALAASRDVAFDAIADRELDAALAAYQAHYSVVIGRATQVYEGVREGLARLAAMGLPLAVVTNKSSRFVRPHLRLADIESYFALVLGADDLPSKKPEPGPLLHVAAMFGVDPARLLMVGDSINDAQAARAAGCPVLIVPYGYNEGQPVQTLDADGIVPSLAAVADRIRPIPIPCVST